MELIFVDTKDDLDRAIWITNEIDKKTTVI